MYFAAVFVGVEKVVDGYLSVVKKSKDAGVLLTFFYDDSPFFEEFKKRVDKEKLEEELGKDGEED